VEENKGNIVLYKSGDQPLVKVSFYENTVWLSQKEMVMLFGKSKKTISEHINNILFEGELSRNSTVRNFRTVQKEGDRNIQRSVTFYNLDMIIAVGYRVRSVEGTRFRIWATNVLKKHLIEKYKSK